MKVFKSLMPLALITMATAFNGQADVVLTGGTFVNLTGPFNGAGTTFFDNVSDDNLYLDDARTQKVAECNIGALLTGQTVETNCKERIGSLAGLPTGNTTWQYLQSGGSYTPWTIQAGLGTTAANTTLLIEFAGRRDVNEFGYYKLVNGVPVDTILYSGATSGQAPSSFSLNLNDIYGFYIKTPEFEPDDNISKWRSGSNNQNRVQIFRPNYGTSGSDLAVTSFLIAFEDGSDYDFQDGLIFATVVPEPASIVVLSGAVLGTLALVRRRRNAA